jgi:peroxiredoxin Q/BCP
MIDVGHTLPPLELVGDDGATHPLRADPGALLVVYFYPKDSTPGCTREGQAFTALREDFARAGAQIAGISRDSVKSHCQFKTKSSLSVLLLSDPDKRAHHAFGAWGEKLMYGKKTEGAIRSTFVLDEHGTVLLRWPSVKVDGHAEAVLEAVRGLARR